MDRIEEFQTFVESQIIEESLVGRDLKAQKFVDLCIAVAEKAVSNPDEVRRAVKDHTLSYGDIKKFTDAISKI